jgi:hypothetical protein
LAPNFRVNECCQISTIAALFSGQPLFWWGQSALLAKYKYD